MKEIDATVNSHTTVTEHVSGRCKSQGQLLLRSNICRMMSPAPVPVDEVDQLVKSRRRLVPERKCKQYRLADINV